MVVLSPFESGTKIARIEASVTNIDQSCFVKAKDTLQEVIFEGENLEKIDIKTFYECFLLVKINLEKCINLKYIYSSAFAYCYKLVITSLPSSLIYIGSNAFRLVQCDITYTLSKELIYICGDSFLGTKSSFHVDPNNKNYSEYEGSVYTKDFKIIVVVSYSTKSLIFHPNTSETGDAFTSSSSLEEIIIPSQIKKLGKYPFHYANKTKTLNINYNTTIIDKHFVRKMYSLERIVFTEGIEEIKFEAFSETPLLKVVILPDTLKTVEEDSFVGCKKLQYVTYKSTSMISMLVKGGIPKRALIHPETCKLVYNSLQKSFIFIIFALID